MMKPQIFGNGIEGENYIVNDEGKVEFPEGKDMTNSGWTGLGASYNLPNPPAAGLVLPTRQHVGHDG